ncbi:MULTISPECIES: DeoR/GlpR family DNA-binding transcription regulator [unclassified Luteococcus]|uniref:DeoR/GlpR family DNA-binding transcription regulator n=1 Tax=unclassified Luteococcus TaxID=2639923 RepID=UPI00313B17B6
MVSMNRQQREAHMLDLLARDGSLSVGRLARDLGVSEVTIRGQLRDLENRGLLARTHGGAQSTSVRNVLERERLNVEAKERIARAAAALVKDGDSLMIEAGTTTSAIVRHLANRRGIQIVTNSTLVFAAARNNPELTVILTGGTLHRQTESLVGPVALRAIREFHVQHAFVGTDGFTTRRGLTTPFAEGAEVIVAMREQADSTWLVADASKCGRAGFVRVLGLEDLDGIITDDALSAEARTQLKQSVPRVMVV